MENGVNLVIYFYKVISMKKNLLPIFLLVQIFGFAQNVIIPAPNNISYSNEYFIINKNTTLVFTNAGDKTTVEFFRDYVEKYYSLSLAISNKATSNYIQFLTLTFIQKPQNEEHYTLSSNKTNITIQGDGFQGTFYGMQSLIQLLPTQLYYTETKIPIPCAQINDQPRFAYRGMHLDVGRHFFEVDFIKKYIDFIALHKMNTFHWHLTEDQGWRIEIKKYPLLTKVGAYRNGTIIGRYPGTGNDHKTYGGFYTQEQIKEIVQYASERFITVIPEIELPGHSMAALTAYPELGCTGGPYQVQQTWGVFNDVFCAGKENTFHFLENVLDEVMELFPSKYIHIGGDECPKDAWKKCVHCQNRIKENNLKDEHELQSYFIQRIEKYVNNKGKSIIGWDEILEGGLAPNATVMSWRGEKGGIEAAKQNHNVIMTPGSHCYLDHSQSKNEDSVTIGGFTSLEKIYHYEPIPKELNKEDEKYILGAQGNVWTEYMAYPSKVEYQIFPRMSALAEVLWSNSAKKNWNDFLVRMKNQYKRYEIWNTNFSYSQFEPKEEILFNDNKNGIIWKITSNNEYFKAPIIKSLKNNSTSKIIHNKNHLTGIEINKTDSFKVDLIRKNKILKTFIKKFEINKATGKTIQCNIQPSTSYPGFGGMNGLINGLRSNKGFSSPEWLGWKGNVIELVIDLNLNQPIQEIILSSLQQKNSWIYLPEKIEVFTSLNNEKFEFKKSYKIEDLISTTDNSTGSKLLTLNAEFQESRFIKLVIYPVQKIQPNTPGAGNAAWLFLDEIIIN